MSQITLKTSTSAEQTASSPLAWLSRAGFGVITLLVPSPCLAGRIRYF